MENIGNGQCINLKEYSETFWSLLWNLMESLISIFLKYGMLSKNFHKAPKLIKNFYVILGIKSLLDYQL